MIAWLINFKESRIKFPDQPEKFMESEMELHDAVQVSSPPPLKHLLPLQKKSLNKTVIVISSDPPCKDANSLERFFLIKYE